MLSLHYALTMIAMSILITALTAAAQEAAKVPFQLAMAPELTQAWMSNGMVLLCLLGAGIVAALLIKLKPRFFHIIGAVVFGILAVAWGWYVLACGYWDGGWFLNKSLEESAIPCWLFWVAAGLFPLAMLICRPSPEITAQKMRWGQFNMLVILIGLAYAVAILMIRFWQLNTWATVVFVGLPALYVLLLLFARVSALTLLMSIPSAIVATLVAASAIRQSMAVSMIFALILDVFLLIIAVITFANIGQVIPDMKTYKTNSTGGAVVTKYDALQDIRDRNWNNEHSVWK